MPLARLILCSIVVLTSSVLGAGCRSRSVGNDELVSHDAGPASLDASVARAPESAGSVHIVYPPAPGEFIRLTDEARRAVVNIRTNGTVTGGPASMYPNARPDSSLGSGFLVDRQDGYILTNLHIVERAASLHVIFHNGEQRDADIVGRAPHLDIALLQLGGRSLPEDIPQLSRGESDNLRVGEWVLALGNPFGGEVTASAGILSSVGNVSSVYEPPQERFRSMLHTDAAIHRGNTGGPLLNLAGEVVGVNMAMDHTTSGFGFAVPMSQVNRVFEQLAKGEVAETWLGVYVMAVTEVNADPCPARGVLVTQVVRASPAAKAGVRVGDIITRFDGHEIDEPKLAALSRSALPGQRVDMLVCRAGNELTRTVVVEEKPR